MVDAELTRLSSNLEISLTRFKSFVGLRVGTKPCRLCLRLADDDAVSLLLRLISLPPVRSGAMPGLFKIVGALMDATRACDRCGTGGGRCSDEGLDFNSPKLSAPLMLGRIGKRPPVKTRLGGRGVSTLLSLRHSSQQPDHHRV